MDDDTFARREELQRIPSMPCGLYRSGVAMAGHEDHLGADVLVLLHDHRPDELPSVLFPVNNENNRWAFSTDSHPADDPEFLRGLVALPDEGFYVLNRQLQLSDDPDDRLPEASLVMLGYNRKGHSILFPARFQALQVVFPERGYRFESADILAALEPANFDVPPTGENRSIH